MTCFWDGILRSLNLSDFNYVGLSQTPLHATELCIILKRLNKPTDSVYCNGKKLTRQQLKENYDAVEEYNVRNIYSGYFCSTMDPFLCLISDVFRIRIEHDFNGYTMVYSVESYRKIIKYRSNYDHFWYG
jgi:hypothetical protein